MPEMCLQEKVYKYLDNMTIPSMTSLSQLSDNSGKHNFNCNDQLPGTSGTQDLNFNATPSVIEKEDSILSSKTSYDESYCSSEYEPSESLSSEDSFEKVISPTDPNCLKSRLLKHDQPVKSRTDSVGINDILSIKENYESFTVTKVRKLKLSFYYF